MNAVFDLKKGYFIVGLFGIEPDLLKVLIRQFFASKSGEIIDRNLEAAGKGYQMGAELSESGRIFSPSRNWWTKFKQYWRRSEQSEF